MRNVAYPLERPAALISAAVRHRHDFDDSAGAPVPVRAARRDGTVDSLYPAQLACDPGRVGAALDQDLVRKQCTLADAGPLERDEAGLRVAGLGDRVGVGAAQLQVG